MKRVLDVASGLFVIASVEFFVFQILLELVR